MASWYWRRCFRIEGMQYYRHPSTTKAGTALWQVVIEKPPAFSILKNQDENMKVLIFYTCHCCRISLCWFGAPREGDGPWFCPAFLRPARRTLLFYNLSALAFFVLLFLQINVEDSTSLIQVPIGYCFILIIELGSVFVLNGDSCYFS